MSSYQGNLQRSMRGSNFIFESIQYLFINVTCKILKVGWGGSYIDSPDWIKKKKATINLKNTDDSCF